MELEDTVKSMLSSDYKERFKAEYQQVYIRWCKLTRMLRNWRDGKLDFEPACSYDLLDVQCDIMHSYMNILEHRAKIEGIDLYD